jgi:hypothetical protein
MRGTGLLVIAGCLLAMLLSSDPVRPAAASPVPPEFGPVNLCTAPDESTAGWQIIWLHGGTVKIPTDYALTGNAFNNKHFAKGAREAAFGTWMGLGGMKSTSAQMVSSCRLTIGGRPAKITLYQGGNWVWWATADWDPLPDGRSFEVFIAAQYPNDLMAMRTILWSAQFPGYEMAAAAPACDKPTPPVVDVADVLDTGLVSMLAAQEAPPLALGTLTFEFSFDSTGGLMPLDITETDMPDSTIRRVAVLVGSNIKPQKAGAPRAAVKLMVTPAGVSYRAVAASACKAS